MARSVVIGAPAAALFDLVADPHLHHQIDGSGTVQAKVSGPQRLSLGATFTVKMSYGKVPYTITSTTTEFVDNKLIEWQHPMKHRWRWKFRAIDADHTEVTEVWDYHENKAAKILELMHFPQRNAASIEATLAGLAARY